MRENERFRRLFARKYLLIPGSTATRSEPNHELLQGRRWGKFWGINAGSARGASVSSVASFEDQKSAQTAKTESTWSLSFPWRSQTSPCMPLLASPPKLCRVLKRSEDDELLGDSLALD